MNFNVWSKAALLGIAMCVATGVAGASGAREIPLKDWKIEPGESSLAVAEAKAVRASNFFGNLRVRTSSDASLHAFWVTQRHASDPRKPRVELKARNGEILVRVVYPEDGPTSVPDAWKPRRIDLALLVPPGVPLSLETGEHFAESKGHRAHLDIKSRSGKVKLRVKGSARAHSDSGDIQATFQSKALAADSSISGKSGNIKVILIGDPDMRVAVDTAGRITTDYSIEIDPRPGGARKIALARMGAGGATLSVRSETGNVSLRRLHEWLPPEKSRADAAHGVDVKRDRASPAGRVFIRGEDAEFLPDDEVEF